MDVKRVAMAGTSALLLALTPTPVLGSPHRPAVAVVDTGVDLRHRSLRGVLWRNPGEVAGNRRDDDGNGIVDDVHGADFVDGDGHPADPRGHGTHVAGIVARRSARGRLGRQSGARIMALRVIGANGRGSWDALVRALDYAVAAGARVINLSIAYYQPAPALRAALERAGAAGALVVTAAGNESEDLDSDPVYPASFHTPGMVVVGAAERSGALAAWSASGSAVDLIAPGSLIRSSLPRGRYGLMSGTSQATARVSRAAAILLTADPARTADDLRAALVGGADDAPRRPGGGLLDLGGALARLVGH